MVYASACLDQRWATWHCAFTKRGLLLVVKVSGDRDHTRVERGVVC
jgi:hypothetical protein